MNIDACDLSEKSNFFTGDFAVSYSNIEITHVNDNKLPKAVLLKKIVVLFVLLCLVVGLFCI